MVLIFSMPKTAKVRNVRLSPAVSLALDSADGGQDIVLAEGRAELIAGADRHPHFLAGKFREKYAQSLGAMSFDQWRSTFSQPLLIHVSASSPGPERPRESPTGSCPSVVGRGMSWPDGMLLPWTPAGSGRSSRRRGHQPDGTGRFTRP